MAEQPLIIRKKRLFAKEEGSHGAWKVAYADFVTAMMAFFMLMWLLNATTEQQRRGLADFFDPTIPLSEISGGGSDLFYGDSIYAEKKLAHDGHGSTSPGSGQGGALTDELAEILRDEIANSEAKLTLAPEGIVVDLIDTQGKPVFALGKAGTTPRLEEIIKAIAPTIRESGRRIKFVGHTDSLRFPHGNYSNWELSVDRANAARRMAVSHGVLDAQVWEVSGQSDRVPAEDDPAAPGNRRISIILLHPNAS